MPALLLVMVTCIVLGMGIPITGSYILLSALAGPALISMGVMPLSAHMFIFYFAVVSVLTPPVATAAYAAAGLSGASPISTGWMAMRLGITGYLVPFIIVYQPALLLYGNPIDVILATITAMIGVVFLATAVQGCFLHHTSILQRVMFGVGSLLMIYPGMTSDLIGAGIIAVSILMQFREKKARAMVA